MFIERILTDPLFFVIGIIAVILALTVHEFAHALAASYFGDNTAKSMGRLTLNPIKHLDPVGFLMMLFAGFGWAKPVPVNQFNLRNPKLSIVIVAIAGPGINILMAIISILLLRIMTNVVGPSNLLLVFLLILALVNTLFAVFNLIPIPPLDGSRVLFGLLPERYAEFKEKFTHNGPWVLIGVLVLDSYLNLGIFEILLGWIPVFLYFLIGL